MLNLYYDLLLLYGNIVSNKSKRKSEGQKKTLNKDEVYTGGDFSGFINVSEFINFGVTVLRFVGDYTERMFGFLTICTQ